MPSPPDDHSAGALPASATPPALDSTLGAWLLGTFLGLLMQGAIYGQAFHYFRLYPNDPRILRILVMMTLILGTLNSALAAHSCYFYIVSNYFSPTALGSAPVWSLKILPVPGTISALITQIFFARRLYLFKRTYRPLAVVALLLTVAFCGCHMALSIAGWKTTSLDEFLKLSWLATWGLGMLIAADVMVTTMFVYGLHTSRTGVKRTNSLISVLIIYAVSSGLLVCVFAVLNVLFSCLWPDKLIYGAISIVSTKLYAFTLLAALNARKSLSGHWAGGDGSTSGMFKTSVLQRALPTHLKGVTIRRHFRLNVSNRCISPTFEPATEMIAMSNLEGADDGSLGRGTDSAKEHVA